MDVEKKHTSKSKESTRKYMKKFVKRTICIFLISFYFLKVDQVKSLIPYYYFPSIKNLQKQSLSIGKNEFKLKKTDTSAIRRITLRVLPVGSNIEDLANIMK